MRRIETKIPFVIYGLFINLRFLPEAFINGACVLIVAVTSSIKFENDFLILLLYLKERERRKLFIDDCKLSIKLS